MAKINFIIFYIVCIFLNNNLISGDPEVDRVAHLYATGHYTLEQKNQWEEVYQRNKENKDPGIVRDFMNHAAQGWGQGAAKETSIAVITHINKFVDPITDTCAEFIFGAPVQKQLELRAAMRMTRKEARVVFMQSKSEYRRAINELERIIHQQKESPQQLYVVAEKIMYYKNRESMCETAIEQLLDQEIDDTGYNTDILLNAKNENFIKRLLKYVNSIQIYQTIDNTLAIIAPSAFKKDTSSEKNIIPKPVTKEEALKAILAKRSLPDANNLEEYGGDTE